MFNLKCTFNISSCYRSRRLLLKGSSVEAISFGKAETRLLKRLQITSDYLPQRAHEIISFSFNIVQYIIWRRACWNLPEYRNNAISVGQKHIHKIFASNGLRIVNRVSFSLENVSHSINNICGGFQTGALGGSFCVRIEQLCRTCGLRKADLAQLLFLEK